MGREHRAQIGVTELDRQFLELRLAYPAEVSLKLMNLVDSHDIDRIASMLLNSIGPSTGAIRSSG